MTKIQKYALNMQKKNYLYIKYEGRPKINRSA